MTANHVEHSRDWSKIKSLLELSTQASTESQKFYSLEKQKEAEELATFLMYSSLTTRPLDRNGVSELLSGTQLWKRNGELVSISKGIEIEYLEKCSLVMFEAGWLLLTCNLENYTEQHIDDSLVPVIETLRTLQHIQRGQGGYKKPNLFVSDEIWNREFTSTSTLLSCVEKEDNSYVFNGREHNLNQLVSTFLWQKLLANSVSPKEAFEQWLRIMRLTCSTAFPVLKYATSDTEFNAYTAELQKHLFEIPVPLDLARSISNCNHFSHDILNYTQTLSLSFGVSQAEGESNSVDKCVKQPRQSVVTKDSLSSHSSHQVSKNEFSAIQKQFESITYREGPGNFYSWLISEFLEASIYVDNHSISYPHTLIKLIDFTQEHPLLKHMLFGELFRFRLSPKHFCVLLSRIETCNFAMFWFTHWYRDISSQIEDQAIVEALEVSISKKYVDTNSNNADCNEEFLDIVLVLTDKLGLYKEDFKDEPYYTLFDNFLKHQEPNKILSMIDIIERVELCDHAYPTPEIFKLRNNTYFLLWWLYDFIDRNSLDTDQVHIHKLVHLITNELEQDLILNCQDKKSNLNATNLISQFPWQKLVIEDNGVRLLSISTKYKTDWSSALLWTNDSQIRAKGAISCYFQILMAVANHDSCQHLSKLHKRIMSIADHLGFDTNERHGLFQNFGIGTYELWSDFCVYINKVAQSDFEDFLESNTDTLTNSQLFQLMECCIHPARKEILKSAIADLSLKNVATTSINDLERTFISACRASEFDLAQTVLAQASNELNGGRFKQQHNNVFDDKRKLVKCYQYKLNVMLLVVGRDEYDLDFQLHVNEITIPFKFSERIHYNECEYFRRYYLAYYLIEHDTPKSILILEGLVKDTNNPEHLLMMLHAYLANHHEASNITLIRNSLTKVEQSAKEQWSVTPSYPLPWISGILQAYLTIDDVNLMRQAWDLLSSAQKVFPQLLTPYCELLLKHNLVKEADIAFSVYMRFLGQNEDLLPDELDKISRIIMDDLAKDSSVTGYIDRITEKNQRSAQQLASSFKLINGSSAEEYVKITNNSSIEEYLVQNVTAVSKELLSRSKSLYIPYKDETSITGFSSKPAKEDSINQWFCSLFNMREKNSPLNFWDQSQIGSSATGKGSGEVDGVIVNSHQNTRIALFEAFRLPQWGVTPINEHMDKLSGYDREGFDTVFVVVYAFDNKFSDLLSKYKDHISKREHVGYIKANSYSLETVNGEDSDTFWMGKEQRMRGNVTVSIYHIVINFNCGEEDFEP